MFFLIPYKEEHPETKNIQVAFTSGRHTQTKINLLKVLNFVQEIMKTFTNYSNYSKQLQTHLDINLTHHEKFIKTFVFFWYNKLLNKNLNSIPTWKRYNNNKLSSDLKNFFQLIKLRARFKDETCITTKQASTLYDQK